MQVDDEGLVSILRAIEFGKMAIDFLGRSGRSNGEKTGDRIWTTDDRIWKTGDRPNPNKPVGVKHSGDNF